MDRRDFMKAVFASIAGAAIGAGMPVQNIIYIKTMDQFVKHFGQLSQESLLARSLFAKTLTESLHLPSQIATIIRVDPDPIT